MAVLDLIKYRLVETKVEVNPWIPGWIYWHSPKKPCRNSPRSKGVLIDFTSIASS
jgi:hypothetical protein